MQDLWFTGETRNQFILYIGGLFGLLYIVALLVGYTQRRCEPVVVSLTTPEEHEKVHEYILVVKTSLLPFSGCPSTTKVSVQLQGQFHNSPYYLLKQRSVTGEILKRGAVDIFVVHSSDDLGGIESIGLELIDDVCEKSVWRPSCLEVYSQTSKTNWSSEIFPALVCQQKLETHVTLNSKKEKYNHRHWGRTYLHDIFTNHTWLSITQGTIRFGSFTALFNLHLFFCGLALTLAVNLLCLLFIQDANPELDITQEKVTWCIFTTLIIVCLSWSLEAVSRNIKPYSRYSRSFSFKGLNDLKRKHMELERSYKVVDIAEKTQREDSHNNIKWEAKRKMVKVKDVLKAHFGEDNRHSDDKHIQKDLMYVSSLAFGDFHSLRDASSVLSLENLDRHNLHTSQTNTEYLSLEQFEVAEDFSGMSFEDCTLHEIDQQTPENKLSHLNEVEFKVLEPQTVNIDLTESEPYSLHHASGALKEVEVTDVDISCFPNCCLKRNKRYEETNKGRNKIGFKFIHEGQQFSDPLELSQHYAKALLSNINILFSQNTLDSKVMRECFHQLQWSLSENLIQFFTRQPDVKSKFSTYEKLQGVMDNSIPSNYRSVFEDMQCEIPQDDTHSFAAWRDCISLYGKVGENEESENMVFNLILDGITSYQDYPVNLNSQSDIQDFEDSALHECQEVPLMTEMESGSWFSCSRLPSFYEKRESQSETVFEPEYCRCRNEDCRKCSRLISVIQGLSIVMVRNSIKYVLDMWHERNIGYLDKKDADRILLKRIENMLSAFIHSIQDLIQDGGTTMEVDEDIVLQQSAAAVIIQHALKKATDELMQQEELEQIQNKSKNFISGLVEDAVAEIKTELQLEDIVRSTITSAVHAAIDEVWTRLQDPVHVFAEICLKETVIQQIREKRTEKSKDGTPVHSDPAYELLQTAVVGWMNKLEELPMCPKVLLTQSLINKYEKEVNRFCDLVETLSEYNHVEWQIRKICVRTSKKVIQHILWQVHKDISMRGSKDQPTCPETVLEYLDILLVDRLDSYVQEIEHKAQSVLYEVLLKLKSKSIVQHVMQLAQFCWKKETKVKKVSQHGAPLLQPSDIEDLRKELQPLRMYLKFVDKDTKQRNEKQLSDHIKRINKKQKEYVSINLQNILDSYCVVDNLPRDYTEEELYIAEWFVSEDLNKALPAVLKKFLVSLMVGLTAISMVYVIGKGAELTTAQSQEWTCLVLISLALFGLVFEPLKVLLMMCIERGYDKHPDYT